MADALMKNFEGWKRTANPAVDMVAEAVYQARIRKRPLRTIHLKPAYFSLFVHYTVQMAGEESIFSTQGEIVAPLEFDGVAIVKGSQFQANTMAFDFWPVSFKEVEAYREHRELTGQWPEHLSMLQ